MLFKNNSLAFRDVGEKEGIVSGYFASFDSEPDSDGDIIQPGAFSKTIKESGPLGTKRIKHFLDHDPHKVVGVITELFEDSKGLAYVSRAGSHTLGVDFVKMVQDEIITEHSFGYKTIASRKGDKGWNYLTELKMWEGTSMQAWGANQNTPITGLKSHEELIEEFDKLIKALKCGTYTDETMLKLQERQVILSEYFKTTQPNASSETTVPSEGKEEQTAKGFNSEVFFQHFKTAFTDGNERGASGRTW
ncbi:HK97 family phage prohead protease [Dyadobacter chenwenxiniae]|uniref:HK97 family phage prohead protease n=1 Tax=Dyadobacter chenwenxiniae TaxID=2906456 RepID=A0A9X1PI77_9BACT|nr:HK97 family phage prohead protease [Dyadobacter chenwenxiniae]MCF0059943.1 HK97 family phage prohead protease [Dyadobacter chenwenxiniae]UON85682.1 HK97 family phage prohead protease [Dyadobacter chenwenxiniae]